MNMVCEVRYVCTSEIQLLPRVVETGIKRQRRLCYGLMAQPKNAVSRFVPLLGHGPGPDPNA